MAEQCVSCGAELFEGQQFCRACGVPTRRISGEELPTQMLPHEGQQPTGQTPLATAPLSSGRNTSDPVYGTNFPSYQQPIGAPPPHQPQQRYTSPVGVQPPPLHRRRSRAKWFLVILGIVVFFGGASLFVVLFVANRTQPVARKVVRTNKPPFVPPPMPPHPMDMAAEEALVDGEGAEISGSQTVTTKTYPLAKDGSFELHNISGNITVEGWDEQQAEVKIIRRGGSAEARDALKIMHEQSAGRLAFNTMPEGQGGVREVEYQVKLPRNLRELEIVSNNSNVELTGINTGSISINLQRGNIELEDVSGTINSRTMKGNTTVVIGEGTPHNAPQVFNGISGNIELELAPGTNAELKAETVSGAIEIDEEIGVKVEKRMVGQQAVGRIGTGGDAIVIKTVSGNIKIKN